MAKLTQIFIDKYKKVSIQIKKTGIWNKSIKIFVKGTPFIEKISTIKKFDKKFFIMGNIPDLKVSGIYEVYLKINNKKNWDRYILMSDGKNVLSIRWD